MRNRAFLKRISGVSLAIMLTVTLIQPFAVYAQDGNWTEVLLEQGIENPMPEQESGMDIQEFENLEEWSYSIPEEEFSTAQVGDCFHVLESTLKEIKMEVIDGESAVRIVTEENKDCAEFIQSENVRLKVTGKDESGRTQEKILDFIVHPRTPTKVTYLFPNQLKLGDSINGAKHEPWGMAEYENCLYGEGENGEQCINPECNIKIEEYFIQRGGWGSGSPTEKNRKAMDGIYGGTAYRPGVLEISSVGGREHQIAIGDPYRVVIEEPVIQMNLSETVRVGTTMNLTTSLENTHLDNYKIEEFPQYDPSEDCFPVGYRPRIEVLEGENLIERKDGDYSNTLYTSETITFSQPGKVVLKIVYEMIEPYNLEKYGGVYSPEKTIAVEVTPELVSNSLEVSDKTGAGITADTSGLDLKGICEKNGVDPTKNHAEVVVSQGETAKKDSAVLGQKAKENGHSVKTMYEILMSLFSDGNKIAELTDNFGNLKLNLHVGKEYAGQKAVVYQLHNGTEIITHSDLNVKEDGTVAITVNKLSAFAVAIENGSTAQTPVSGNKVDETTPKSNSHIESAATGDNANIVFWSVLCIIGGIVAIFLVRKNFIKRMR